MWNLIKLKRQNRYEEIINELLCLPESEERNIRIEEALTKYYEFCAKNNLKNNLILNKRLEETFIIESNPIMFQLELEKSCEIAEKLRNVVKVNNGANKLVAGITFEEAETLLKTVIGYTRNELQKESKKYNRDFSKDSLAGVCGEAQLYSIYPFYALGLPVTINNTQAFPEVNIGYHSYGTVSFPIFNLGKIEMITFLVDTSYRQFFTSKACHRGMYIGNKKSSPDPGYFVCKSEEGKKFSKELLKNGYIILTPQNAYLYGHGFSNSLASIKAGEDVNVVVDPNTYLQTIFESSEYFDFSEQAIVEMVNDGTILSFKSSNLKEGR